uniref:EF-hand domain-containing protein n=1 Tax=Alexandrium catenella TaxID=2925 RepID=A0A7S1SCD7_ALECA|mmetsp:Transcript_95393/g.253470  ORF Transcript_95393/g.253470 Transcript_95393/m.253470 type:complete len:728 (+) Transcript_95393:100-2283(+)
MGCGASIRRYYDLVEPLKKDHQQITLKEANGGLCTAAEGANIVSSPSSRRTASHILQNHEGYAELVKHPTRASLPDGSPLITQFRRVFLSIGGDPDGIGVTAYQLEAALQRYARALSPALNMRVSLVVSDVFEDFGLSVRDVITWPAFVEWLERRDAEGGDHDEALSELFELCDYDGTGRINAQELMDVLLLVSQLGGRKDPSKAMSVEVAESIVRDLDSSGQGGISLPEFMEVVQSSRLRPHRADRTSSMLTDVSPRVMEPHLVLNFDVNNTIVMLDSLTGADSMKLLGAVFANAAWGVVEKDDDDRPLNWVLKHGELSILAPEPGLNTYKEYADMLYPVDEGTQEQNAFAKKQRKAMIWKFPHPGHPGERFCSQLEQMNKTLLLPEAVRGTPKAIAAGLKGNTVQVLPSFLHMLRELKKRGRSFTLIFRTFGNDLELVQKELNALCEGRHPLFPDDIKLDGSDGQPDYRMYLGRPSTCGTFFRNPAHDDIALVMGTIHQPRTMEEFPDFYNGREGVSIARGPTDVISKMVDISGRPSTIALRDFYGAWSFMGLKSRGGKPFFLSWHDDSVHSIFFDDNITAADPKIVDPINARHWPQRFCNPQLLGVHLVQAQPLFSITNRDYFLECISECEAARCSKLKRWDLAQRLLGDLASVQHVLTSLVSGTARKEAAGLTRKIFEPWCISKKVSLATQADTFDEDYEDFKFLPVGVMDAVQHTDHAMRCR